jgi:hypothetical protein
MDFPPAFSINGRIPLAKKGPESDVLVPFELALSEKRIPQIAKDTEMSK